MECENYFKMLETYIDINVGLQNILNSYDGEDFKYGENNKFHNFTKKQIIKLKYFVQKNHDKKEEINNFMSLEQSLHENQTSIFYMLGKSNMIPIIYDEEHSKTPEQYDSIGHKQLWETILFFNKQFDDFSLEEKLNLINEYSLTPRGRAVYDKKERKIKIFIDPFLKNDKNRILNKFDLYEISNIQFLFDHRYTITHDLSKEELSKIFENKKGFNYIKETLKK